MNTKIRNFLKYLGSWFLRWAMGFPVEPGLKIVGNPDQNSPVFLTCNFYLTVRKVLNDLRRLDCYVLIANTKGINVWSSSCGGDFNHHSVISVIKTSGIEKRVKHRILVLPQSSAPGINAKEINEETGWTVKFGPVYAKDVPDYVKSGFKKTPSMYRLKWPLFERFEVATSCGFLLRVFFAFIVALFIPSLFWPVLAIVVSTLYFTYLIISYLPIKSGLTLSLLTGSFFSGIILAISLILTGDLFAYSGLAIIAFVISLIDGFDFFGMGFSGSSALHKSEFGEYFWRFNRDRESKQGEEKHPLWISMLIGHRLNQYGTIHIDEERCVGCGLCYEVCPMGVYEIDEGTQKAKIVNGSECINCNACLRHCVASCLSIV